MNLLKPLLPPHSRPSHILENENRKNHVTVKFQEIATTLINSEVIEIQGFSRFNDLNVNLIWSQVLLWRIKWCVCFLASSVSNLTLNWNQFNLIMDFKMWRVLCKIPECRKFTWILYMETYAHNMTFWGLWALVSCTPISGMYSRHFGVRLNLKFVESVKIALNGHPYKGSKCKR